MKEKSLFGEAPITSISFSNDEIIKNIMQLCDIPRFDLDCTYSKGEFWKKLPQPINASDIKPKFDFVVPSDSSNLPYGNEVFKSIMFDPPFLITGKTYQSNKKGSSIIGKRFEGFENFNQLKQMYLGTLKEAYRVLENKGFLVFKCQDVVSSGKNHFTHCMVMDMAISVVFYPKDLYILLAKNRINAFNGEKWKNQHHARKHHSYFWVFQKTKNRVNYQF